ncbi:MAG: ribosome biogenesis GTPase YlqF [Eubacteriales bacterium]|nr:ribosome biogenesis GTPase YlqF [Eubacteriales bacterium]
MHIQWYPGHMTKAMRMMQDAIKQVDCVIYVLDCRAVSSCINPKFDEMIAGKPVLYVLNKKDLVPSGEVKVWLDYFASRGLVALAVSSVGNKERNAVLDGLKKINAAVISKYREKGVNKIVRAMVVGVPNSGKSTLINCLCAGKRAVTGNRPGVTRGKQWVRLDEGIELLDTPGTLPPSFEDQGKAVNLAFVGSIKEDVVRVDELAIEFINFCKNRGIDEFCLRYGIDGFEHSYEEIFDAVGKARGVQKVRGEYDYDRVASIIMDDFRKQKFGKIMLDYPEK